MDDDTKSLAREALNLLKIQAEYFARRQPSKLNECKEAERRLKVRCQMILAEVTQPGLFPG